LTRYFAQHPKSVRVSVSAVVWREPGARDLLLIQRSDHRHWGLPGGFVEPGESVSDAAAREVLEETGFRVEVGRLVGVYSDPAQHVVEYPDGRVVQLVNLCFEARPLSREAPKTPEEALATGFFPLDRLPEPMVPIHGMRIADAVAGGEAAAVR
jgi:ADP-ribose pyrophosphatase YjhB (NUDIX family)